ncbi:hypothetical protein BDV96DRAFT_588123 [Lophiotrema nucula]|uniref:DUF7730 domain-containing protein n=1 Tax=Lophiotrema nucula TaxID=690887 RepID=A0A6A5YLP9_9PLEO|nr:hypothetical protein BDV96DRAFT_588123 [Lophiotrema nucula]
MRNPNRKPHPVQYACAALCFPIGCFWLGHIVYRKAKSYLDDKKLEREYKKHALPNLTGKGRKRALTLPLEKPSTLSKALRRERKVDVQEGCLLFTRLPVEVRAMIWEFVLGGNEIAIENWYSGNTGNAGQKRPENWWTLVKTCRVVYSETINLLYAKTIFDVKSVGLLSQFKRSVLEKRWSQIRALTVCVSFWPVYVSTSHGCVISGYYTHEVLPSEAENWPRLCGMLESLPNLRRLKLIVFDPKQWVNCERLEMLRRVGVDGMVEVTFTEEMSEDVKALGERDEGFRIVQAKSIGSLAFRG